MRGAPLARRISCHGAMELWSLPEDVMLSIFSRLSVYDIVRIGCTCTRLRAFISSHRPTPSSVVGFLALVYPCDIPPPDVDEHLEMAAWMYDRSRGDAWLQLSLAFLEPDLPVSPRPVASAGGLLCFGAMGEFLVCNPITRSHRRLPDRPLRVDMDNGQRFELTFEEDSMEAFGMMYDSVAGTYDFFILYHSVLEDEKESRMMHYSSALSQWRVLAPLVADEVCELHTNIITPCNSGLYTLMQREHSIVVFAYCDDVWSEIEAPKCPAPLLVAYLMDVHGDLHMVGGVGSVWLRDDVWEHPTSVCIWKLNANGKEWIEVTRMPSAVLQEFRRLIKFNDLHCWGKDGVMYMKGLCSDVLMCELSRSEWKWLKGLDLEFDIDGLIF